MSYITIAGTGGGGGSLTINATPITGATGAILWDDTGILQEITVGSGLSFSGGTLSATSAPITINTTPIIGGISPRVLYDNAGVVGEAANFNIQSGNPNATVGYYVQSLAGLYVVPNINGDNWFEGEAGNFSLTGYSNFGTGNVALVNLTSGQFNTAVGPACLHGLSTGNRNIGLGAGAGFFSNGDDNLAIGYNCLNNCTVGTNNITFGTNAGIGIIDGGGNIFIGTSTGNTIIHGSNNIVIGNQGDPANDVNGQIVIGNFIYGTGCTGSGPTISSGWIGIGVKGAYTTEAFGVNGTICTNSASAMIMTNTAYTNGAAANTATFTNAPVAGNPTKWIPIVDAGVTRYIPAF
jgi:hypothetical protein